MSINAECVHFLDVFQVSCPLAEIRLISDFVGSSLFSWGALWFNLNVFASPFESAFTIYHYFFLKWQIQAKLVPAVKSRRFCRCLQPLSEKEHVDSLPWSKEAVLCSFAVKIQDLDLGLHRTVACLNKYSGVLKCFFGFPKAPFNWRV